MAEKCKNPEKSEVENPDIRNYPIIHIVANKLLTQTIHLGEYSFTQRANLGEKPLLKAYVYVNEKLLKCSVRESVLLK